MVSLFNNIDAQNVVDRFADYVRASANSGIVWGTNSRPGTWIPTSVFGGTTAGKTIEINGNSIGGPTGLIVASTVRNVLIAETNRYTRIRNLRARLLRQGNNAVIYDQTRVAHMSSAYQQTISNPSIPTNGPNAGNLITIGSDSSNTGIEEYFARLRSAYNARRGTTITLTYYQCHSSCHSSCHGSRGRR